MRDYLRSLPVFAGVIRDFDTDSLPDDPVDLFGAWLRVAVEDGVPEPHAMTLSTSDASGTPDARVLILKELDERGWWFATGDEGTKSIQLADQPSTALTFYWPLVARQVIQPPASGPSRTLCGGSPVKSTAWPRRRARVAWC